MIRRASIIARARLGVRPDSAAGPLPWLARPTEHRAALLLAGVGLLLSAVLTGCGAAPSPASGRTEPITSRAIAAIALRHLPTDTTAREATYVDEGDPAGTLGADLRYRGDGEYDGDLVRITLVPRSSAAMTATTCEAASRCAEVAEGVLLTWEPEVPEEDPGLVRLTRLTDDAVVSVLSSGRPISADPRTLELSPDLDALLAVVTDPDLALRTTASAVAAGAELTKWQGGEVEPAALEQVPHTGRSLAVGLISPYGDDWRYLGPSPLRSRLGPRAVGGRLRVGAELPPVGPGTIDVIAALRAPRWLRAGECPDGLRCRTFQRALFAYRPAAGADPGEAWLFFVRPDGSAAALHTRGPRLPARINPALAPAGAWMYVNHVNGNDEEFAIAMTTSRRKFEQYAGR